MFLRNLGDGVMDVFCEVSVKSAYQFQRRRCLSESVDV